MLMLIVALILLVIWLRKQQTAEDSEPPAYPGALPLVGHAYNFIGKCSNIYNFVQEVAKYTTSVGGVISAKIGPRTVYVITDPEDCTTVVNSCLHKDFIYEFATPWLGDGLVTSAAATWKVHRKLLNPAFSPKVLNTFLDIFNKQARSLCEELSPEVGRGPFDQWQYTRHNALETICLTALGVDFSDKNIINVEYVHAVEEVIDIFVERFKKIWWHNNYLYSWSSLKKQHDKLMDILLRASDTVLQKRKAQYLKRRQTCEMEENEIPGTRFKIVMDLLLELSIEKGAFNNNEIREHIDTIIIAGYDTTSITLMFSLLLIGSYPQVQDNIYKELSEVFGSTGRDVTRQDLTRLVYLEAVLKECLRIYPTIPVIGRYIDKDVKLRNCTLKAGRSCLMLIAGLNKHTCWGSDAEDFKPERWLDPAALPKCPGAFAAFSVGKRNCIGKTYALMSMKTTLAHLLRRYRVKGDHSSVELKADAMLKPVAGFYISIETRT